MDAAVSKRRTILVAYGKAMRSCRPDAGVKLVTMLRIAPATETTKPVSGENME
jgi:hypothetical protein